MSVSTGRKVANSIRRQLFGGILLQDIAFFDGNSTGQLISRLTNDVSFMVSPLQTMLGTLLSNVLLLIGGFSMAFYTSWRLSILAFCTIGPIMHVTQVYAQWSQWLYRQIYAALAAANGVFTQQQQ
jgi:ABC-type multidrug transport system fused ATPase/permease subunit